MPIINRIAQYETEMTEWRHYLHSIPELNFDTVKTAEFVVERLREFGVDEIVTDLAQNSVVGIIDGRMQGPTIGLRADMDALPIMEATGLPHASTIPGRMHACGHDGHTAMLLGAARYLSETRNFCGKVVLVFQPAEEGAGGGRAMVEEGLMARFSISQIYAIHNWPGIDLGRFETRTGAIMAASDNFEIRIWGKAAHAAMPHQSIDPILVASAITQNLQAIAARRTDPNDTIVVSVTQIEAGEAINIIPQTAVMKGTLRTLKKGLNDWAVEEMSRIAEHTALAFGATAELICEKGYPVTTNDPAAVEFATSVAKELVGPENVDNATQPSLSSEDFAYMLGACKGAYVFLGQGDTSGLHQPEYDFNDDILTTGASYLVKLVESAQPTS